MRSSLKRTQFEISVAAADAFLTLVAAQETVRAAQAGVDRAQSLSQSVRAQVDAQLRPGADASRTEAELAAARTQLVQAQQAQDIARASAFSIRRDSAGPNHRVGGEAASASPGTDHVTVRCCTESHSCRAECPHRSKKGRASSLGEVVRSEILCAGFRLCAGHRSAH